MKKANNANKTAGILLLSLAGIIVVGFVSYIAIKNQEAERLAFTVPPASTQEEPFIQSDANSTHTVNGLLVDGFPTEAPIYTNSRLVRSNEVVYNGKTNYSATWQASGNIQQIIDYYRQQITNNNWEIVRAPEQGSTSGEQQIHYRTDSYDGYITVEIEENPSIIEIAMDIIPL